MGEWRVTGEVDLRIGTGALCLCMWVSRKVGEEGRGRLGRDEEALEVPMVVVDPSLQPPPSPPYLPAQITMMMMSTTTIAHMMIIILMFFHQYLRLRVAADFSNCEAPS